MKTSGFRCETKFGLLAFLGHPNVEDGYYMIQFLCKNFFLVLEKLDPCIQLQSNPYQFEICAIHDKQAAGR